MVEPIIEVKDFRKNYGHFTAVDGISFEVTRRTIFGLLGPNGAGKTTTLECLEGIRTPDGGQMRVAGIDPTRDPKGLRSVIGVQLQSSGMPESITPEEAMKLFCAYHGVAPRHDLLDRLGLGSKRRSQYHELSTGQQRRLSLALAVAHHPQVILLDEPTAGLDVQTRVELHNMMRELKADGATIILATHDMAEAEEMADCVAILLQGKIVIIGSPLEITSTGAGLSKVSVSTHNGVLLGEDHDIPAVLRHTVKESYSIYYSNDIGRTVSAVIAAVESCGDTLIDLRVERPSLEDRFLELTNNKEAAG
jgi:ABC-2 type transport system ATP-binding protein